MYKGPGIGAFKLAYFSGDDADPASAGWHTGIAFPSPRHAINAAVLHDGPSAMGRPLIGVPRERCCANWCGEV